MSAALPSVSVITASYQRADLLPRTIDSVLAQGYPRLEYIVLDDGSTDRTQDVLARYGDRLRAFHHPNMGESRSVNRGLSLATGDILMVLSSDDTLAPGALHAAVEQLEARPELVGIYPDYGLVDVADEVLGHVTVEEFDRRSMFARFMCFPSVGACFRRQVFEATGGRDPSFRYVADFDFWLRTALLGPLARIPATLANMRIHGGSATLAAAGLRMAAEYPRLVDKVFSLPDLPPELRAVEPQARSCAYMQAATACGFSRETWLPRVRYNLLSLRHCPRDDLPALAWRAALVGRSALGPWVGPLDRALRDARDRLADGSPRFRRAVMALRARGG